MVNIINKFGVNWKISSAKTNALYIIENESFYNTCKKWFMLVQDKNNITQYLAYHNTTTAKNIITTHIKTSTYSSKQKLYEIANIELNKDDNLRTDYDTIFTNKNLYAIPDTHIDIIEKIDPSLGKYIDCFKNDNIINSSVNNDLLKKIIIKYNNYRKSQSWMEQYKYGYFEQHNHIFDNLDNLEEKIKNLGSPNFAPFMWKTSVFRYLCEFHLNEFKNVLVELFNENEDLTSRINLFLKAIKEILINSPNWKSKDKINVRVESASFFLALKDPTKYLLYTRITPYNTFSKNLNINITTKNEDKYVQWIKYCNDILIPEMNNFLGFENNLLDCQDLIWWYHNIAKENNDEDIAMDNNFKEQSLNQILYGPPGTGKTYNTIIKAMEIINDEKYDFVDNEKYKNLKKQFDDCKQQGQIEFVTFHQSYSYEEFVEGIKPYIPEWGTVEENNRFIGKDGIFKKICKLAERNLYVFDEDQKADFDKIYKIFQEKYETGSSFSNLLNIKYEQNNLVYHYGSQPQDRRIDLNRIKEIFNSGKQYSTAIEFNKDYKGNAALKGYFFNFYQELLQIKNDYIDENKIDDYINQDALKYVLIIDEINRGDISKIFGELITLIEKDKRIGEDHQITVTLPYSRETFGVPKNLYIIGTMNTADRSIALLDTALRRRFDFEEMMPKTELLRGKNIEGVDLEQLLTQINDRIKNEYDRDHQIGHSYLMEVENKEQLERAYKNRILPLLNEYFYNDIDAVSKILNCKPDEIHSKENWFNVLKEAQKPTKKENEQ